MRGFQAIQLKFGPAIGVALGVAMPAGAIAFEPFAMWLGLGRGVDVIGAAIATILGLVAVYFFFEARRSRKTLESIIDNIPLNVAVKNATDFSYILVNKAWEKYTG